MNPFHFERADHLSSAVKALSEPGAKVIAGGTNLLDLMKENVARPSRLVHIGRLPLRDIQETKDGIRLGAMATNADTARHPLVKERAPLLSQALLAGASPQLRNMATNGGNLLQRTRCYYFYDVGVSCNKRAPGTGCPAMTGQNRIHAVLGASDQCIAVHPSDMCVALRALDAVIHVEGPKGRRAIPIADFHRLPGATPHIDTNLAAEEIVVAIELPNDDLAAHSYYLKLRDRRSYAFALVSVAAALALGEDGNVKDARIALGGVAHKPWRDPEAEQLLIGRAPTREAFASAAAHVMRDAQGHGMNDFKIELARRAIVRSLGRALAGTEVTS